MVVYIIDYIKAKERRFYYLIILFFEKLCSRIKYSTTRVILSEWKTQYLKFYSYDYTKDDFIINVNQFENEKYI